MVAIGTMFAFLLPTKKNNHKKKTRGCQTELDDENTKHVSCVETPAPLGNSGMKNETGPKKEESRLRCSPCLRD